MLSSQQIEHNVCAEATCVYRIAGNFRWVKYHAPESVFSCLIFVVHPEHVIIVAEATIRMSTFSWLIFRLGALRNERKKNQ